MKEPGIEGLRGASALSVLGFHVLGFGVVASAYFRLGLGGGFAAVYVFFALSAYLLVRRPVRSWRSYYTARVARIFPTWLVVLPAYAAVGILPLTPWALGAVQNYLPSAAGFPNPSWTLSVEVVFYAALPIWRRALDASPWTVLGGGLAVTVGAAVIPGLPYGVWILSTSGLAYATGSLAAKGVLPSLSPARGTALALASFGLAAIWPELGGLLAGASAGLLLMNLPSRLARLAPLGAVAYPLYLAQYPILWALGSVFADPWAVAGLTVAASLCVAIILHRFIERPFMDAARIP